MNKQTLSVHKFLLIGILVQIIMYVSRALASMYDVAVVSLENRILSFCEGSDIDILCAADGFNLFGIFFLFYTLFILLFFFPVIGLVIDRYLKRKV